MEVINLTNKVALYNFLSTFSGTHYVSDSSPTDWRAWDLRLWRSRMAGCGAGRWCGPFWKLTNSFRAAPDLAAGPVEKLSATLLLRMPRGNCGPLLGSSLREPLEERPRTVVRRTATPMACSYGMRAETGARSIRTKRLRFL